MADRSPPTFELRNAGIGPDPLSLDAVSELVDFAILLLLRDYHCPKCRAQVNRVAEKAESLERRDTAVIPVLPDSYEKAASWQDEYDLPFPLLADPEGDVGDAYDQQRRFGALGKLHDVIGRMPKAVVMDVREDPTIIEAHDGSNPGIAHRWRIWLRPSTISAKSLSSIVISSSAKLAYCHSVRLPIPRLA